MKIKSIIGMALCVSLLSVGLSSCGKGEKSKKNETSGKTSSAKEDVLTPNSEKDFKYTLTEDGTGVCITEYIGTGAKIIIPETIEGLPVKEVTGLAVKNHEYGEKYWSDLYGKWVSPKENITITHISFPDTVEKSDIPLSSFNALVYLKISAGLKQFGKENPWDNEVFDGKTNKEVFKQKYGIYENCKKLKTVILPEGVTYVDGFNGCESLEKIELPSTVNRFGDFAFRNCKNLSEVVIPESVTACTFGTRQGYTDFIDPSYAFEGTNLNLTTQAKIKSLGYEGKF